MILSIPALSAGRGLSRHVCVITQVLPLGFAHAAKKKKLQELRRTNCHTTWASR